MTDLYLYAAALADVRAHASEVYAEEACGILVGHRRGSTGSIVVERALRCANVAPVADRRRRFEIDPRDVIETQRALRGSGAAIIGFYHTHPDTEARPSSSDLPFFRLWPRTVWLILEVRAGHAAERPRAWWLDDADAEPVEVPVVLRPAEPDE